MADKILKARVKMKTDTTANWDKQSAFIPLKGEIIVYNDDGLSPRIKIGNGSTLLSELPFIGDRMILEDSVGKATQGIYINNDGEFQPMRYVLEQNVRSTSKLTDEQVVSAEKHYIPIADEQSKMVIKAVETERSDDIVNLISGINIEQDTKGHIVNVTADSITLPGFKNYVPSTRMINNHSLEQDIILTASDVGAAAFKHTHSVSDIIEGGTFNESLIPLIPTSKLEGTISVDKLTGVIPSSLLPSYVDDVLEYNNKTSFPTSGESGKIYIDKTTSKSYRWSGSIYTEISSSLALGETSSTAFQGDLGKIAYEHATAEETKYESGLYKITINTEGHITKADPVSGQDIINLDISEIDTGATDITVTGAGNVITDASYDPTTRTITLIKGATHNNSENYTLPIATYNSLGGVKPAYSSTETANFITATASNTLSPTIQAKTTLVDRYYAIESDKEGRLFVNVPWESFTGTTGPAYNVVSSSSNGLAPAFGLAASGIIDSSDNDWVLTSKNGNIGWYKLPTNVFKNDVIQDTNTTYTFATGSDDGTFTVTPSNGTAQSVAIKGLGSNAYTSTAYLPLAGGTVTGTTIFKGKDSTSGNNVSLYLQDYSGNNKTKMAAGDGHIWTSKFSSYGMGDNYFSLATGIDGNSRAAIGVDSSNNAFFIRGWKKGSESSTTAQERFFLPAPTETSSKVDYGIWTTKEYRLGYIQNEKNYPVEREEDTNKLYVNVPWTDNNTNYYHTPSYTSTVSSTATGIASNGATNVKIATGTGVNDLYIPVATATTPGIAIVYPAASCTTFSSDAGTVTPLAVQKGAKMFAITRPSKDSPSRSVTPKAIARWLNEDGDLDNSKITIEDVTNSKDSSKKAQVITIPAEGNKKMVYGYCTDQVDGTSFIGGVFDASATSYPYNQGLAIGGTSGNLLWKGARVATADDLVVATTSKNGLMSTSMVAKLNGIDSTYTKKPITYHLTTGGLVIDSTDGSHETYASMEITETSTGESLSSLSANDTIIADVDLSAATANTIDSILDDWGTVDRIEVQDGKIILHFYNGVYTSGFDFIIKVFK